MPGETGLEPAEHIRATRPGTPVILATGSGETTSDPRPKIQRLGKPFNQSDLRRAVAEAMAPERN